MGNYDIKADRIQQDVEFCSLLFWEHINLTFKGVPLTSKHKMQLLLMTEILFQGGAKLGETT